MAAPLKEEQEAVLNSLPDDIPTPVIKIDNQHDPFATVVTIEYGDRLGELLDTVHPDSKRAPPPDTALLQVCACLVYTLLCHSALAVKLYGCPERGSQYLRRLWLNLEGTAKSHVCSASGRVLGMLYMRLVMLIPQQYVCFHVAFIMLAQARRWLQN